MKPNSRSSLDSICTKACVPALFLASSWRKMSSESVKMLQNCSMLVWDPGLWVEGMRLVICGADTSSRWCWWGLNMSFGSTTLTTGATGGEGRAFFLLIALRRACRRADFDMAVWDVWSMLPFFFSTRIKFDYIPMECIWKAYSEGKEDASSHRAAPLYQYTRNVESYNVSIVSQACFPQKK